MRALARGLRWVALGLGLLLLLGFGAFFFFVFEKEQQFWDAFEKTRPSQKLSLKEVPRSLQAAVLFSVSDSGSSCDCGSFLGRLKRNFMEGVFDDSNFCHLETQLVRQVTEGIWPRSVSRHLGVIVAVCNLTRGLSRDEILEEYLSRAYLGEQQYGFSSAARYYFRKDLRDLNLEEVAGLAGMLKAPAHSPKANSDFFRRRRDFVLEHLRSLPEFGSK